MNRIASTILSVAALLMLTIGTSFAAGQDCCPNGSCCNQGCSHCQHHK